MLKRFTVLFLSLVLLSSLSFAQSKKLVEQKAQKVDETKVTINESAAFANSFTKQKLEPTTLFFTDYDYPANQTIPKMLEMYDLDGDGVLDPIMVGMKRIDGGTRAVQMAVGLGGEFTDFAISDPTVYTGWGTMQIAKEGPVAGNALVMGHAGGNSWFWSVNLADFSISEGDSLAAGNFPDFLYMDDGTMFLTNSSGILYQGQATDFTTLAPIASFDQAKATDWPSEYPLKKSANGEHLLHYGAYTVAGGVAFDGLEQDSADYVQIDYSNDGGATWTYHEDIAYEGITELANRPGTYPNFENFGQVHGNIANDGTMHITDNGYSFAVYGEDTLVSSAGIYWNSRDREWIAFTDEMIDTNIYSSTNYERPGNGFGAAYPVPVISEDGNKVVILWQGPEYSAEPYLEENLNLWEATTENPAVLHYTDLYYVWSGDGGKTFTEPEKVPGAAQQMVQESYPAPYQFLIEDETDQVTVHYVYMVDAIPGTSLFDNNNSASNESYWVYDSFVVDIPVGVEDGETLVTNYSLEQNYPNPFNPSTTIEFNLQEKSFVSLKVYDVLGKEVATLVNGVQEAGANEVTFNASDLASGMYIYKLEAGNFSSAKKMMLLK